MTETKKKYVNATEAEWEKLKKYCRKKYRSTPNNALIMIGLALANNEKILTRPEKNLETRGL